MRKIILIGFIIICTLMTGCDNKKESSKKPSNKPSNKLRNITVIQEHDYIITGNGWGGKSAQHSLGGRECKKEGGK